MKQDEAMGSCDEAAHMPTPLHVTSRASSLESMSTSNACDKKSSSIPSDDEVYSHQETSGYHTAEQLALANLCINTIRFLCVDAINHAKSGHPGICMGMAASAFVLFDKHLRFNPHNPQWPNRDRFILSAGHGSMLLYALLYMCGYKSVTMHDIKQFRKLHSKTPGHPECTETPGVEVSTGPLGQGICNAVGIAIAEAHLSALYNRPGFDIIDNYTYCIVGDGCMMEGMTAEACSLAGHLKLGKLIVLYDDNHISIDGSTDLTFTEDVTKRFQAYNWQVLHVQDGNRNIIAIDNAIQQAKRCKDKPTLIKITTTIGYGSPNKQNSAKAHGSALGEKETTLARKHLGHDYAPFEIPRPALEHLGRKVAVGQKLEQEWHQHLLTYSTLYPKLAVQLETNLKSTPLNLDDHLRQAALETRSKCAATRKHSSQMLNMICDKSRNILGGSADTSPSTLTDILTSCDFTPLTRVGRNLRFGVREHAMAAICNGICLSGYNLRAFCSTFLVFSDYMRGAIRMAALSNSPTLFILTHDSILLGEDGPSHQPIEHLASLRAMPNLDVWRPADGVETAAAYAAALRTTERPSAVVLTRQTVGGVEGSCFEGALRGGYVVKWEEGEGDGVVVATGSEVGVAMEAAGILRGRVDLRVVSMVCWEEFERQGEEYCRGVLGGRERCVSVEAGCTFGWERFAGWRVGVDRFGLSGGGGEVGGVLGVGVERVVEVVLEMVEVNGRWGGVGSR